MDTSLATNQNIESGAISITDSLSLRGGGQRLGRNQLSLGIAAGTDRTETIIHDINVSVDPSKISMRRFNQNSTLRIEIATTLQISNDVTGDILVTRNLPRNLTKNDTAVVTVSAASGWRATARLEYPNVPLARNVNVLGLQGTMVTRSIDHRASITNISLN